MTGRLHIGTHKGLFELARHNGVWDIVDVQFLGDPVSACICNGQHEPWRGALTRYCGRSVSQTDNFRS